MEQFRDLLLLATAVVAVILLLDDMGVISVQTNKQSFDARSNYLNMLQTSGGKVYQKNRV